MALELPSSLSPSKVSAFKDCALAFRYSAIDRLPEPPSVPATRGTLVHAALERLFALAPHERDLAAGLSCLSDAFESLAEHPDYVDLELDADAEGTFLDEAEHLVRQYFTLEDPTTIHPIGIELKLEIELSGLRLRGIIDRLELSDEGELVVTDYKSGAAPKEAYEQSRLTGVQFYSLLCERLFGQRPARIQLLYLRDPTIIVNVPTEQSTRALERRLGAVWSAIERACDREDFRPRPSRLCNWCSFKDRCPAFADAERDPTPVAPPSLAHAG